MARLQKHKRYNVLHCTPMEAICSAGARLPLLVVGGTNGVKGAHGESASASPRVWAQRQSPWSAGQGRTFAMAADNAHTPHIAARTVGYIDERTLQKRRNRPRYRLQGQTRMDPAYHLLDGMHICATWRIQCINFCSDADAVCRFSLPSL